MLPIVSCALAWALARGKEPSTYSGLGAMLGAMWFLPHATQLAQIALALGVLVCGGAGVVLPERGTPH